MKRESHHKQEAKTKSNNTKPHRVSSQKKKIIPQNAIKQNQIIPNGTVFTETQKGSCAQITSDRKPGRTFHKKEYKEKPKQISSSKGDQNPQKKKNGESSRQQTSLTPSRSRIVVVGVVISILSIRRRCSLICAGWTRWTGRSRGSRTVSHLRCSVTIGGRRNRIIVISAWYRLPLRDSACRERMLQGLLASSPLVCCTAQTAVDARSNHQQHQNTDTDSDTDNQRLVVIDPGFDLAASCGATTSSVAAKTVALAWRAVDKVLRDPNAGIRGIWGAARNNTVLVVTGTQRLIAELREGSDTGQAALLIAGCTLSGGTLFTLFLAAGGSVFFDFVIRASSGRTGAGFLRIAFAVGRTANSRRGSKLAVLAAVLVDVANLKVRTYRGNFEQENSLAHCAGLELASLWLTARVYATSSLASAIALFARFDDAIAA